MAANQIQLSCNVGAISKIVAFGISSNFEDSGLCIGNSTSVCKGSLNTTSLSKEMNKCLNQTVCRVTNLKSFLVANKKVCGDEDAFFHA
jgi:hypothetical protein